MTERVVRNYRFDKTLGEGTYGITYKATNLTDGKIYAVKEFKLESTDQEYYINEYLPFVLRDAQELSVLDYKYLVKITDYFIEESTFYLVSEYCEIGDLAHLLQFIKLTRNQKFTEDKKMTMFLRICQGVQYYQRLITHKDLKPGNIFLSTTSDIIKIGDFGFGKQSNREEEKNKIILHQPNKKNLYDAPELEKGKNYNEKTDIWSLGCILYEMFFYDYAYKHIDDIENGLFPQNLNVPLLVKDLVTLMLNEDSTKRPSIDQVLSFVNTYRPPWRSNVSPYNRVRGSNLVGNQTDVNYLNSEERLVGREIGENDYDRILELKEPRGEDCCGGCCNCCCECLFCYCCKGCCCPCCCTHCAPSCGRCMLGLFWVGSLMCTLGIICSMVLDGKLFDINQNEGENEEPKKYFSLIHYTIAGIFGLYFLLIIILWCSLKEKRKKILCAVYFFNFVLPPTAFCMDIIFTGNLNIMVICCMAAQEWLVIYSTPAIAMGIRGFIPT